MTESLRQAYLDLTDIPKECERGKKVFDNHFTAVKGHLHSHFPSDKELQEACENLERLAYGRFDQRAREQYSEE